jgi:putative Ca2+/H+ antiporter (TMEM165/GDT1 family)
MPGSYSGGQLLEIKQLMMLIETQLFLLFATWLTKKQRHTKTSNPDCGRADHPPAVPGMPSIV